MKKISREERERFLSAWKASGQPVKQFCREQGLNHYTFYGWLEAQRKKPTEPTQAFVELKVNSEQSQDTPPLVIVCGPYRIELVRGFDRELLKTVLEVLGAVGVS